MRRGCCGARAGSRFTRDFKDWVACLAAHSPILWTARLSRIEWKSVGGICRRVYEEIEAARGQDHIDGLRR